MTSKNPRIGFIGFGEVAYHFSKGFKREGIQEVRTRQINANELKSHDMETEPCLVS
jgi:hypothetical protein